METRYAGDGPGGGSQRGKNQLGKQDHPKTRLRARLF